MTVKFAIVGHVQPSAMLRMQPLPAKLEIACRVNADV